MFYTRAHLQALETQIDYLKAELEKVRIREDALLNRLLARHNVEPIQGKPQPAIPDAVQVISPFGSVTTPEMVDALKESWVGEESAYLMAEHGMDETRAKEMAEQRWISEHRVRT